MVTCYVCSDTYHHLCHTPKVTGAKSKWHCRDCNPKNSKQAAQPNSNSSWINNSSDSQSNIIHALPPVLSPQVSPNRDPIDEDFPKDAIDPNIPDASDWTSEQVYQYFARLFPKEAEIFRSQVSKSIQILIDSLKSNKLLFYFSGNRWPFSFAFKTIRCSWWSRSFVGPCAQNLSSCAQVAGASR